MVFLKYVRLLLFTSLCAASAVAVHGSDATCDPANEISLQFNLWSNWTAVCDAVLSSRGVRVAVSYRTDLDSDNWIPLEPSVTNETSSPSCKLLAQINWAT